MNVQEFDTGLDYLTTTFRCRSEWESTVGELQKRLLLGSQRHNWRFLGYSGYTHESELSHCAYGWGFPGGIIQVSGDWANYMALQPARMLPDGFKVTRMDLAVTMLLTASEQLVRTLFEAPRDNWHVILPTVGKGGGTLYVGARTTQQFGRLYDKGAELNAHLGRKQQVPIAQLWRAEMELKGAYARRGFATLADIENPEQRREFIASTVITWFGKNGIPLGIIPTSSSIVSVASRGIDDVRTIKWFHEQVRPALIRLVEVGKGTEALKALGLNAVTSELETMPFIGDGPWQMSFFDNQWSSV